MNGRGGVFKFFLFLFLFVMVVLQILAMIQADRLYERLNTLISRWERSGPVARSQPAASQQTQAADENRPGDDGDWLVWHILGEPRTLNPISVETTIESREVYSRNLFETLFDYDLDYDGIKLKPYLAESMEISEDGLEITVKLKEHIWFSDGVPVTADDVLFTYQTMMDPNIDAADLRNYYDNVKDVVKIDDRTVKFIFKEIYWKTLESVGMLEILPRHIYQYTDPTQFNKRRSEPVGTGPYAFERWDVGQQVVLRRNESYWGDKPKIERMVFKFITNMQAALQALRAGDLDTMEPSSEQFFELSQDEQFKEKFHVLSYWQPSKGFSYIGWNQARPWFRDRRVRLALTHVVNREAITKHIQKGFGKVASGPFYINGKQSDPNIKPWPFDIDRAKQLLDEAGWRDSDGDGVRDMNGLPLRFKLSYPAGSDTAEQIVKMFKDDASKIGADIIADTTEWSIYVERLNNRDFDAAICSWGGTIESDPYQIFHSSQIAGRGNNFVNFNSPDADAVIERARRALDADKRYALYHRFHQILHYEQPYTFLVTRPTYLLLGRRFQNVKVHKLGVDQLEWYVPKDKQKYK